MILEIGQKPVLVQVVRLGQPKLKRSARYSKVYIRSDRTPKERIRHKKLVKELKNNIQVDSSKHWKMSKGGVTSVDTGDTAREVIPAVEDAPSVSQEPSLDAPNGEIESPVKEKSPCRRRATISDVMASHYTIRTMRVIIHFYHE